MAKKKKETMSEEIKKQTQTSQDILKELNEKNPDQKYVISVPDDAIIDIQISGYFRRRFEEVFYYLLSPLETDEIIMTLQKVKNGLTDVEPKDTTVLERSVSAMMTLMNEINYQAAKQNKTQATDKFLNESLSDYLHNMNPDTVSPVIDNIKNQAKAKTVEDMIDLTEKAKELYQKNIEDSTEDSSQ